jgi:hypothetical protein
LEDLASDVEEISYPAATDNDREQDVLSRRDVRAVREPSVPRRPKRPVDGQCHSKHTARKGKGENVR